MKIMKDDKKNLCSNWHALLRKDLPDLCITSQHLEDLMEALKVWLPEQNVQNLTHAVSQLKDKLDNDVSAGRTLVCLFSNKIMNLLFLKHSWLLYYFH